MKKKSICIIGLGYVGLPLFFELKKNSFNVVGFDNDNLKILHLKKKYTNIKKKFFSSTNDIKKCNVYIVCVPTPLNKFLEPDTSFIKSAIKIIISVIEKGDLIIFESTCYPGCTKEMIINEIEKKKEFKFKKDFFVSYSPERIDPANKKFKIKDIPKVIGSECKKSLKLTDDIYNKIFKKTFILHKFEEAELSKLIENVFRQVNIGLMNEMAMMCKKLEINIWNAIKASSTKPFGFMSFYPGPGTGGHCIPLDPNYLSWKARSKNFFSRYIDLSNKLNQEMPEYVIKRAGNLLRKKNKVFSKSRILVIGLSYKKNVPDYRESPSLKIFQKLFSKVKKIKFHDNFVKDIKIKKKNKIKIFRSINLTKKNIGSFDLVIILTAHSYINWTMLTKHSKNIFDTRFVCKNNYSNVEFL